MPYDEATLPEHTFYSSSAPFGMMFLLTAPHWRISLGIMAKTRLRCFRSDPGWCRQNDPSLTVLIVITGF
jgi:hypothetical protein